MTPDLGQQTFGRRFIECLRKIKIEDINIVAIIKKFGQDNVLRTLRYSMRFVRHDLWAMKPCWERLISLWRAR